MLLAFAAMGFGLFTGPVLQNLYLEDHFGLEAFGRGVIGTINGIGVLLRAAVHRASATTPCSVATRPRRCGSSAC